MGSSLPSRFTPPIAFARRGAATHAPPDSVEAFVLARRLGATGLAGEVWLTADGHAVLHPDGMVGGRLRRRPIREVPAASLPPGVPRLVDLYGSCGIDFELSLEVGDPDAVPEAIAVARDAGAEDRLWLVHGDRQLVASWRQLSRTAKLVDGTRLRAVKEGPERRAADLAAAGFDALRLPHSDWTGGLVTLVHRFDLYALGDGAQFERIVRALLVAGIDGVYGDEVDVLVSTIDGRPPSPGAGTAG